MYLMCLSLHLGYIEMLPALFLVYVLLLQMDDRLLSRHDLAPHGAVLYLDPHHLKFISYGSGLYECFKCVFTFFRDFNIR
jgi:hypothetical protein